MITVITGSIGEVIGVVRALFIVVALMSFIVIVLYVLVIAVLVL